ncbi:hypothetical protein GF382_02295 [Candidatus Falkowbacteria bacterium]|nr:hypothetical protein [Candidatus Falkowbacteria bacterium]
MKKRKKILIIFLALAALALALLALSFATNGRILGQTVFEKKDPFGCDMTAGYEWCDDLQRCINTKGEKCPLIPTTHAERVLVEEYLSEHLSELSPKKEVLGGKFYLGDLNFEGRDKVVIDYEDGHIVLRADVFYEIEDGQVQILEFKIIREN